MRIFKIRQNMLVFHLLTFNTDPFPSCSLFLLCWATWNQNAFQLHQSRNALCPLCCKARPSNATDSRSPPCPRPLLCLWQWLLFSVRPPALQAAVRADMFTKLSATLFASPCTVQKILQQALRGKKDKMNLPLTVKLTRTGFFSLAHIKYMYLSALICSVKTNSS